MMTATQEAKLQQILTKVGDLGFKRRVETLLNWLEIKPGDEILDCGCGEGFYSMVIAELYQDVTIVAFDFNAELLQKASSWVNADSRIKFQNGHIETGLPFADKQFDKIIFTEVLEHLDHDAAALKEIFRVLKPGGVVGLTVPNKKYPFLWDPINWTREHLGLGHFNPKNTILGGVWSYDHKRLYSFAELYNLSQTTGFEVLAQVNLTHYCMPFNYLILRLGKLFATLCAPKNVRQAMEKFAWDEASAKPSLSARMLNNIFNLFKRVDAKNDAVMENINLSSVSIGLKLTKQAAAL